MQLNQTETAALALVLDVVIDAGESSQDDIDPAQENEFIARLSAIYGTSDEDELEVRLAGTVKDIRARLN